MASHKAHELAERFLRQRLIVREFCENVVMSPQWQRLREIPVVEIGGDLGMAIDIDSGGVGWVMCPDRNRAVSYKAGLARSEDGLAEPVMEGLRRLDEYLETGADPDQIPQAVAALLGPFRA